MTQKLNNIFRNIQGADIDDFIKFAKNRKCGHVENI